LDSERIVQETKKLIGIPFCHYGRSTIGLDCLGLVYLSHSRAGLSLVRNDGLSYPPTWWKDKKYQGERLLNGLTNFGGFEIVSDYLKGCLITFRLFGKDVPVNHVGIMINENQFIHASSSRIRRLRGVHLEDLHSSGYYKRFAYFLKHKDIKYVW